MDSSHSSSITDGDMLNLSQEEVKKLTFQICDRIRKSFKDYIFGDLKNAIKREKYQGKMNQEKLSVKDLSEMVLKKGAKSD